ncbi:hypothetical protein C0Q70_13880 [Pomacea canaliculata]|uniref:Uncharacterized protein n=1 Tax=Pomacea canaliculata TaxID=400727 RepID=A0A2T7NYF9_POMCA|nr:hypothetical protein C0Q70_13880 [Pomacea canaliculata]
MVKRRTLQLDRPIEIYFSCNDKPVTTQLYIVLSRRPKGPLACWSDRQRPHVQRLDASPAPHPQPPNDLSNAKTTHATVVSHTLMNVTRSICFERFSVSRQTDIEEHHERDEEGTLA